MKVTVCFGSVRVVVPCGNGEISISALTEKAICRYKKATGKPNDYWVIVHTLKSSSDGGILDPDDQLNDVADDREQIVAIYEEQDAPPLPHNGGDGTSASSVGTSSPDIFQTADEKYGPVHLRNAGKNDVIITENDLSQGSTLIVRRGSEPALHRVGNTVPYEPVTFTPPKSNLKRWSAIASIDESKIPRFQMGRREPLGCDVGGNEDGKGTVDDSGPEEDHKRYREESLPLVIPNTGGPLGIHVVPDYDKDGRDQGLVIQGIEPGGRIYRDSRLQVMDRIVEINGTGLQDVSFAKAQEIFRQALQTPEIRLRVVKKKTPPPLPSKPPPINNKLSASVTKARPDKLTLSQNQSSPAKDINQNNKESLEAPTSPMSTKSTNGEGPVESPGKKVPPAVPARSPTTALSKTPSKTKFTAPTNTRRIGKKINIDLTKGSEGLGFSITTRDNPTGGNCPIYIKNVLSKGAAVKDGRLKSGDRLLEVNGIDMGGKSQSEAVNILRNTKYGVVVSLVVSRQVDEVIPDSEEPDKFALPRELSSSDTPLQPPEKAGDDGVWSSNKNKEQISFNIPLSDSGSAGLGVSVKGKTTTNASGTQDIGIFIKSIITGGAASKDGRLKINDQLLEVNNELLTNKTNSEAMDTLRTAMQKDGPTPGFIFILIARRKAASVAAVKSSLPNLPRELRVSHTEPPPDQEDEEEDEQDDTFTEEVGTDKTDSAPMVPPPKNKLSVGIKPNNLVLEKLAGSNALRNISYQRATHESMMNETVDSVMDNRQMPLHMSSPTLNKNNNEKAVMIEADDYQVQMRQNGSVQKSARPASTLGFMQDLPGSPGALNSSRSNDNLLNDAGAPKPPDWLVEWDKTQQDKSQDETSPDADDQAPFDRDGFGRQSMSEKRRGHIDPRGLQTYQKLKEGKETGPVYNYHSGQVPSPGPLRRVSSAESLLSNNNPRHSLHDNKPEIKDLGPSLGLKKSSSLESLQTAVQEVSMDENPNGKVNRGMVRGRGCNESFRAAVDRSYDAQGVESNLETLEEESSEGGSASQPGGSARSSVSSIDPSPVGGPDTTTKKPRKKSKKKKVPTATLR